jgi:hypothetical protein
MLKKLMREILGTAICFAFFLATVIMLFAFN